MLYQTPHTHRSHWNHPPPKRMSCPQPSREPTVLFQARVFSQNGVVIDRTNRVRGDLSPDFRPPRRGHRVLNYPALPAPRELKGSTLLLATPASWKNYFHWVVNALPRLRQVDPTSFDQVITPLCRPFHQQALAALGVAAEQIVEARSDSHFHCNSLTTVSPFPLHRLQRGDESYLRGIINIHPSTPKRRLYLSRGDAWRRRIRNEAGLVKLLTQHRFEVVSLAGWSMTQQAQLFAQAEAVVAPHGAGLTNLIFAPPSCEVVELFASNYRHPQFQHLCQHLQLSYHEHISPTKESDPDFDCNLDSLEPLFTQLF